MRRSIIPIAFVLIFVWAGSLHAQSPFEVALPDTSGTVGDTLLYPMRVDSSLSGEDIISYQFNLNYSEFNLEVLGIENEGTLSSGFSVISNFENPGDLQIAGAGSAALEGSGVLLFIKIRLKRSTGSSAFRFDDSADQFFNEGSPSLTTRDGSIAIAEKPQIEVRPGSPDPLTVGDSLEFSVRGEVTTPVSWILTNTAVGTITDNGLLRTTNAGMTRVVAEDSVGIRDTTGVVEIRPFEISAPDTTIFQKQELLYPVKITEISGITSGQFEVGFRDFLLDFEGVETAGTLLESVDVNANATSETISVAFATAQELGGSGILLFLKFRGADDSRSSVNIDFKNILFNETLTGNARNGRISVEELPQLTVSQQTTEMLVGETQQMSISNNNGPVTWSSSDTTRARVDENGLMTARRGGEVTITAVDSIGAAGESSTIEIFDFTLAPVDTAAFSGDTLRLPFRLANAPAHTGFSSLELDVSFSNPSLLEFLGVESSQSLTNGWSVNSNDLSNNSYRIAGAGANNINKNGDLLFLTLVISEDAADNSLTNISIDQGSLTLDEGQLRVRVRDARIEVTSTPLKVSLSAPADDSTNAPTDITFIWNDVRGAETFQFQMAANSSFNTLRVDSTGIDTTTLSLENLEYDTQFYWRVRGVNGNDNGPWSDPFTFSSRVMTPQKPLLLSPEDQATAVPLDVTLEWEQDEVADSYTIQLSLENAFTTNIMDTVVTQNNVTAAGLERDQTYFWRVQAENTTGLSPYSDTLSFTTESGDPFVDHSIPDTTAREDSLFEFVFADSAFADPDGDPLSFSAVEKDSSTLPDWLGFEPSERRFSGTPLMADVGRDTIVVTADDGNGGIASDQFVITIAPTNDEIVVAHPIPDTTAREDSLFEFVFADSAFADPDGDPLSFSAAEKDSSTLPDWLGFEPAERRFSGTPLMADVGRDTIVVTADDGNGGAASDQFVITIEPANDAPVFTSSLPTDFTLKEQETDSLNLWDFIEDAETPDSLLEFNFPAAPPELTLNFNNQNGYLSITAGTETGDFDVIVEATDEEDLSVSDTLAVTVETSVGIDELTGELPEDFALKQNFPNPFNPSTTIQYGLPTTAEVNLTVYDLLGRKVAVLVDKQQSAGFHSVNFDAGRLSSGMYLYRIEAGEFTQTKKLMLVK